MSKWIKYNTDDGQPVASDVFVRVKMENGDKLSSMQAKDINWNDMGDNVVAYKLSKVSK